MGLLSFQLLKRGRIMQIRQIIRQISLSSADDRLICSEYGCGS